MDHIAQLENMKANGFDLGFDNADYDAFDAAIAALRAVRDAPVVTVKADAIGNHIDLPSWHAADPQPGTYRLVPERGEVGA